MPALSKHFVKTVGLAVMIGATAMIIAKPSRAAEIVDVLITHRFFSLLVLVSLG